MPIYAYRCTSCAHAKDVLQKVSDPLLSECPACGAPTFTKQVTAAGFQLKGSGWYVTDFRGGNSGAAKPEGDDKAAGTEKAAGDKPAEAAAAPASSPSSPAPAPVAGGGSAPPSPAPAPAASPAKGS